MRNRARALLCALSFIASTGCELGPKYEPPLRLATAPWIGYTPLHIARDRKLFGDLEIRIADFSTDFDARRSVSDRRVELLCSTLFDALRLIDHGTDLEVILVLDFSKGADGIVARPGVGGVRDLRGKRVAVEIGTLTQFVLLRALQRVGLDERDVTLVNLANEAAEDALAKGHIDAAALWEPFLSRAERKGGHRIFSSTEIPGEILDVLSVRRDALENRPGDIDSILVGWNGALGAIEREPRELEQAMAEHLDVTALEFHENMAGIEFVDFEQNRQLFDRSSERSVWAAYARTTEFMVQNKLLALPPRAAEDVFNPAPLRRVLARQR